jgi:NADH-quinone oxidoreductase subunit G
LEHAPIVVLIAFEPEDESPIVFLRLRKAARDHGTDVVSVSPISTRGLEKMRGRRIDAKPGDEARAIKDLPQEITDALSQPGAVILVGERIAGVPGGPSAVIELAQRTGAALNWVPRRAGERGALDAGALAGLLPGGRPLSDQTARSDVANAWGIEATQLPSTPGLTGDALLDAASKGDIDALLVGGVELADFPDAERATSAIDAATFVVSLENHHSAVTERADVVFPVGVVTEKAGTFVDWEGRPRPFTKVFADALMMADATVLGMLADEMGTPVGRSDVRGIRTELGTLGPWRGSRTPMTQTPAEPAHQSGPTVLASWRQLLDLGVMQEGEPHLAATARPTIAQISETTWIHLGKPEVITVTGPKGAITLPVEAADMIDGVVWLPMNSVGCVINRDLGAQPGDSVQVSA